MRSRAGWYDFFSRFHDSSLEPLYATQRVAAAEALRLSPSSVVLDRPCGTGRSFDAIAPRAGTLIGADLGAGMLAEARARVAKNGWTNVPSSRATSAPSIAPRSSRPPGARSPSIACTSSSG